MRNQPIGEFIWFGLSWRYVQDVQAGTAIHGGGFVIDNLTRVLQGLERLGLQVTMRAGASLVDLLLELRAAAVDARLTPDQASKLQGELRDLQRTLAAEAAGNLAYIVTDKRLDVSKLLTRPQDLFAPGVFQALPEICRHDFAEAGFCIAFERATAAAFHLLRGTEGVLRTFYSNVVKRDRVNPLLWGPMIEDLRGRRKPPPAALLDNMDNIRRSFRNPTQHPEKIYDIQEAQDLFGLCVDVVNRMVRNPT